MRRSSFKNLSGTLNNSLAPGSTVGPLRRTLGKEAVHKTIYSPSPARQGSTQQLQPGRGYRETCPRTAWGQHSTDPARALPCRDHPTAPCHHRDGVPGGDCLCCPCTASYLTGLGLQTLLLFLIGFWGLFLIMLISSGKAVFQPICMLVPKQHLAKQDLRASQQPGKNVACPRVQLVRSFLAEKRERKTGTAGPCHGESCRSPPLPRPESPGFSL